MMIVMGDGVDIVNLYLSVFRVRRRLFAARPRWADTPAPGVFRQRVDQLLGFRDAPTGRRQEEVRGQPHPVPDRPGGVACSPGQVQEAAPRGQPRLSPFSAVIRREPRASPMAPFRNPGSPQEFEPTEASTPGSGPESPTDMFGDSQDDLSLLPDGLSLDSAPDDPYGPVYEGELV